MDTRARRGQNGWRSRYAVHSAAAAIDGCAGIGGYRTVISTFIGLW